MENKKTIYQKIADLRADIKPFKKDKTGFNYKYFDINQMIEVIQPLLEKHKLLLTQPLTFIGERMAIETRIDDLENNEYIKSTTPLLELADAQKMGGCITYFRRYALQSLLFLEAEDDDGKKAVEPLKTPPKAPTTSDKTKIKELCDKQEKTLKTAEDYKEYVMEVTGFELIESNFTKIINILDI